MNSINWNEVKLNQTFTIPGYDDVFVKVSNTHAKSLGCGFLTNPTHFCRKGSKVDFSKDKDNFVTPV